MQTRLLRLVLAGALSSLTATSALAQADPIKFGKIDERDLTPAGFAADSAAPAVVLCDFGRSRFDYNDGQFRVIFERVARIKILVQNLSHSSIIQFQYITLFTLIFTK